MDSVARRLRQPFRAVIVAGPNGAGKSTFIKQLILNEGADLIELNADQIERDMPVAQRSPLAAGRRLLARLTEAIDGRQDFVVETTLTGST